MHIERQTKLNELRTKQRLAAQRLQQIVDALSEAAFDRYFGLETGDDASQIKNYDATLAHIDRLTDEEEKLLREAGILAAGGKAK